MHHMRVSLTLALFYFGSSFARLHVACPAHRSLRIRTRKGEVTSGSATARTGGGH